MMHPTNEEWMSYLYDELPSGEQGRLKTHLETCRECQARVASWQGAMQDMNAWELPARAAQRTPVPVYVKWGIAALLMVGAGYGLARATAPAAPDMAAIRAALEPEIRQQVNRAAASAIATSTAESERLVAELAKKFEGRQEEDRQAVADILERLDAKRVSELANLRRALETVAVNAESSLESAQQQIVQLASITRPVGGTALPADDQK